MAPRVSVLVNNHNYARFLEQAVRSALDQDFPAGDFEVIVVDDASTDGSREVLARLGPRVRAIARAVNGGQAAAFNDGFAAARGEIVCLLDSDDWWAPAKLKEVVARFDREPGLAMVQHWCQEIGPDGKPFATRFPPLPESYAAEDFLAGRCVFTGTTGLSFRAAALKPLLPVPEDLRISADGYLYYAALDAPVGNIDKVLAWRRVHAENRYAGRFHDPAKLAAHRAVLAGLDRELARLLAERGLSASAEVVRRARAEEALEDLFLARYRDDWREAKRLWRESLGYYSGARRLAKGASLGLAVASPTLYLALQSLYARLRNG